MNRDERYILREMAGTHCTRHYRDRLVQSIMLRSARNPVEKVVIRRFILEARSRDLTWHTVTQRQWQSKVSRRPARTNHHDSWAIRESYVRGGSYHYYLPTKGSPLSPWQLRQQREAA